ncbi:MAG: DUF5615 family PIN-like protein [Scytonema sp. CRU_2_7]|nr:DUF5615 family PIN-like protein [Scytonema sp. CRU_2_7]
MTVFAALYTDEDMSALVATLLRSRGLDVATVPEQAAVGKTDSEQLEFATSMERCILTHNRWNELSMVSPANSSRIYATPLFSVCSLAEVSISA